MRRSVNKAATRELEAQHKALAEWRGVDLRPLEVARTSSERPLGSVLTEVMQGLRLDRRQGEVEIVRVWNDLIDPNITSHAQPAGLHKGTLFVKVDNSSWLDEIVRYRRHEILNRLQNSFGKGVIQRISFRIG